MQIPILSTVFQTYRDHLSNKAASLNEAITMGNLSRFGVLLAAILPSSLAVADTPASLPRISSITYSGNGCLKDPKLTGDLNSPTFTYTNFAASSPGTSQTLNCEVHINLSGGSSGWQFAIRENWVKGRVVLPPGGCLDYYTQVFFSQNAGKTVCAYLSS